MRKPAFCKCENKDADQLRGNREADQRLCFRCTDSTIPLLPKSEAIFCGCTARFVSDLVGNPEDRFSHNEARFVTGQSALTIAQKSGDKSVISLIESYANKSVCLKNKKKQRKPRNRDAIRLPLAYSPSPERAGHMTNRSIGKPLISLSLPNSPDRTMENYFSQRPRQSKVDLKLNIGGRELYSKCDSAPVVRSDVTVDNGEAHPLALTSARLERHHYKRDSLHHQPSSLQSDDVLPDLDIDIGNRDFIPDNHLRKQRRPSISLPDLRMAGFLVQSGGSTPTSEDDSGSDSEYLKDSSPELDQEDNVFTQSYQSTKVARGVKTTKQSDRQFTLPEIGNHSSRVASQFSTTNHISPLARSRKYSNSDDQLQRTC